MAADGTGERSRGADPGCTVNPLLRPAASYDGEPHRNAFGDVEELHEQILGGRAQKRCPLNNRHIFTATFSNAEGPPVPIPFIPDKAFLSMPGNDPRTYTIKTAGYDILRASLAPASALRQSDLQNVPAGALRSLKTQLQLAINLWDDVDRFPIIIDWGQEVEVLAESISLHVVGPSGLIYVPADNGRAFFDTDASNLRSGSLVDAVLNASIYATEAPRGDAFTVAWLTTVVSVAATTNALIQVPTNAIAVTGYQSALGAATATWAMIDGPINAVGSIPWVARKTVDDEIPLTNVSHLQPDIDPVNNRIFTLRWKIQL